MATKLQETPVQQCLLEPVGWQEPTSGRHEFDRYDSPHWFVTHLPKHLNLTGRVGEPCKGGGNISSLLPYFGKVSSVWTNDIDSRVEADFNLDAADDRAWEHFPPSDWIVTNPPFNCALPILQNAYNHAKVGVVFFLRLTFIEPTEQRAWWLFEHPRYLDLIYPRFKFRKDKEGKDWQTDSVPIAAFVWRKDTNKILGSRTIPVSLIWGFHDTPLNAPSLESQIEYLREGWYGQKIV